MSDSAIKDYKDLLVWQEGLSLAKETYLMTRVFPSEEKFGLISQIRRAAVSVPSNIAEGQARNTRGKFIQLLSHAEGSLAELDTELRISKDLGFCSDNQSDSVAGLNFWNCKRCSNVCELDSTPNT
jgi:four helix bundle protein